MMLTGYRETGLVICLALILVVLELVRRKKLGVRYSLLWLAVTVSMAVLTASSPLLDLIRRMVGAVNPSSTLFLLGILFSLVILLNFSIKISEYRNQIRLLVKEIGLLRAEMNRRETPGRDAERSRD